MLARNALAVLVASAFTASFAAAQQPAKQAPAPRSTSTTHPQQPTSTAKQNPTQSTTTKPAVSADSAKKVLLANVPGAKVSSERLRRSGGKAYYSISYRTKGEKQAKHATVDANTGAFSMTAPATKSNKMAPTSKPAPTSKKPSPR